MSHVHALHSNVKSSNSLLQYRSEHKAAHAQKFFGEHQWPISRLRALRVVLPQYKKQFFAFIIFLIVLKMFIEQISNNNCFPDREMARFQSNLTQHEQSDDPELHLTAEDASDCFAMFKTS